MLGNVIRGVVGQIKWSYYAAAAIHGYTVTRGKDTRWYLSATVVECDKFKMSQKPLMFVGTYKHPCATCTGEKKWTCEQHARTVGQWFWPITDYELKDGKALTATLGPPV